METINENDLKTIPSNTSGRVFGGLIIVAVGVILLVHKMGYYMPSWVFSWQMLLIAIGMYVGAKHRFRGIGWLIPIVIGLIFMIGHFVPELYFRPYFWPIIIITIGLIMVFKPRSRYNERKWAHYSQATASTASGDIIDAVAIFGGVTRNIISKDFKGGEIVSIFGGTDVNLMQADIHGTVILEANQVFGGTKLIVPAHWKVQTEDTVAIFGGIEDKRVQQAVTVDESKILIIKGVTIFAGLEIKNF